MKAPTAATRLAGVIGDPVGHSLSPVLHNAAFEALDLDWVYVAFPVPAGQGAAAVAAVRTLGLAGLSVTMPHKAEVARAVDRLTPVAERLGVVNTVVARGEEIYGDSTDGAGFIDALRADEGFDPAGRRCVVLGTGGAARAVCLALAGAGASAVIVVGRRPDAVADCVALAGPAGRPGTVEEVDGADLVVNATPVGMDLPSTGAGAGQLLPFALDVAAARARPARGRPHLRSRRHPAAERGPGARRRRRQRPRHAPPPGGTPDRGMDRPPGPARRDVGRGPRRSGACQALRRAVAPQAGSVKADASRA